MAVNVADRAVSDVNRSSFQDKGGVLAREGRGEGGAKGLWIEEPWAFLLGVAILLLVLEWRAYHRRMTV